MDQSSLQIEIRIRANPEYLCVARTAIRKTMQTLGLLEEVVDAITLALDEAMTNAIRHSYGGPCDQPIIVRLSTVPAEAEQPDAVEIVVRDFGKQVDPATIKSRDLNEVRPGGLGVHIIRSVMDSVEYSCPTDGGMCLKMTKKVTNMEKQSHTENIKNIISRRTR